MDEEERGDEECGGNRVAQADAGVRREPHGQLDGQQPEEGRELNDRD